MMKVCPQGAAVTSLQCLMYNVLGGDGGGFLYVLIVKDNSSSKKVPADKNRFHMDMYAA